MRAFADICGSAVLSSPVDAMIQSHAKKSFINEVGSHLQ